MRAVPYSLRNVCEYDPGIFRTVRFSNTYFLNMPFEWNALVEDDLESNLVREFKRKLLAMIKPNKKPALEIRDLLGVRCLTKLRVTFSPLKEYRFRHKYDRVSPISTNNTGIKDNEHFLLHCPYMIKYVCDLFGQYSKVPGLVLDSRNSKALCKLPLFVNLYFK